ncbi:Signal peptidase complex subunit 3 [Trichinella zimbabwensis]|uniref:Signal peptidase complex subunit 3 n=1 Tax=Trichinella zimbabwensis TaxID=268475 RepID=A0A0V1HZA6_9BILA|nr:Signal peptidase complex subunit 3 [Trichinella zimbabwensis]KRZ15901.1 Signal peptidase complex subunit 3 [Trichinella zimbabwensis]
MHSVLSRLNAAFGFTITALSIVTIFCYLTVAFRDYKTSVVISASEPMLTFLPGYTSGVEGDMDLASFKLNLEADFSSMFDWNTKQLFLYLVAEYATEKNPVNEVVIWDKILQRGENPVVKLKEARLKYFFVDYGQGLAGNQNVSLYLKWNVSPNAGLMPFFVGTGMYSLRLPTKYTSKKVDL